MGLDPAELAEQLDVDALIEHCNGSVESALDMYLNDRALCRKVAPLKVQVDHQRVVDVELTVSGDLVAAHSESCFTTSPRGHTVQHSSHLH